MKIAIIDADLIGRKKHRFPNLASMKLSAYHKKNGDTVELKTDYFELLKYDKVYISKAFTDTCIDKKILDLPNVEYGGTGFYYDKATPLRSDIEHIMPDYHLYDSWLINQNAYLHKTEYKAYTDYSIGYLTRGCFRKCPFCVNAQYESVLQSSPLKEFYDETRKKIMLLDDNFLAYPLWADSLKELQNTGKPFVFKQGLDERLLTDEKCAMLFSSKYDGRFIFSFDNIDDSNLIIDKLNLIRKHTNSRLQFYLLCGFDKDNVYDISFWEKDLFDLFERIRIISQYNCLPYIMRFNKYTESPFSGIYITIAQWCNSPNLFYTMSLKDFCMARQKRVKKKCSDVRYMENVLKELPNLLPYFEMKMLPNYNTL